MGSKSPPLDHRNRELPESDAEGELSERDGVSRSEGPEPGAESTSPPDGQRLSIDDVFEVLYNRRRRDVVEYLQRRDGAVSASELAEHIAAEENDTTVEQLSTYERKCVYVGLYQNHLPKMDDLGVVDYDADRGRVAPRPMIAQLEPYMEDGSDPDSARLATGATISLAVIVLLGVLEIGVFAAVSPPTWVGLGAAAVVGLAGIELYRTTTGDSGPSRTG